MARTVVHMLRGIEFSACERRTKKKQRCFELKTFQYSQRSTTDQSKRLNSWRTAIKISTRKSVSVRARFEHPQLEEDDVGLGP